MSRRADYVWFLLGCSRAARLSQRASRHSFVHIQPLDETSNTCCEAHYNAQFSESYSTVQSIGIAKLLSIAVNARCAVRFIVCLHAAPASLQNIRLLCDNAGLSITSFQLCRDCRRRCAIITSRHELSDATTNASQATIEKTRQVRGRQQAHNHGRDCDTRLIVGLGFGSWRLTKWLRLHEWELVSPIGL